MARISKTPSIFILPLKTSLFFSTYIGRDSPVNADRFRLEVPDTITPSTGIFSPAFITKISPMLISSGAILEILPSGFFKFAVTTFNLSRLSMEVLELFSAFYWKYSPIL